MHSIGTEIDQKYEKTKTKIFLGERFLDPLPPSGRAQKPPPPLDIARQERRARSKKILSGSDADDVIMLLQKTFESADKAASVETSVKVLAAIHPDEIVPKLVDLFISKIDGNDIQVSDADYDVFLTPDGVVHDKAVIESLQQQAANEGKNVKRENKAYSYKEQVYSQHY